MVKRIFQVHFPRGQVIRNKGRHMADLGVGDAVTNDADTVPFLLTLRSLEGFLEFAETYGILWDGRVLGGMEDSPMVDVQVPRRAITAVIESPNVRSMSTKTLDMKGGVLRF